MWYLSNYIIYQDENGYHWSSKLTDELVMYGRCTVNGRVLILHSYDDISVGELEKTESIWDATEFYMTVSETGVTEIFKCSDLTPVCDEIKKEIGTQVGCTMRYRQG